MTKKHFIALANVIRGFNDCSGQTHTRGIVPLYGTLLRMLADFCADQNPRFNRKRWLDYIAGKCGPNGGAVKPTEADKQIAALKASANPDDQNDPWRT